MGTVSGCAIVVQNRGVKKSFPRFFNGLRSLAGRGPLCYNRPTGAEEGGSVMGEGGFSFFSVGYAVVADLERWFGIA